MTAGGHHGMAGPWLIVVSDRHRLCAAAGRAAGDGVDLLLEQAAAAAAAGVFAYQLREPDLPARVLLDIATRLVAVAEGRMKVLVNDRADVAATAGADLHLRATSAPAARLRQWLPASTWISRSVHTEEELAAAGPVDAVIAGTVRATASKPPRQRLLGMEGLARLATVSPVPVVGIGGLGIEDCQALADAGAAGLAAIGLFLPRLGESPAAAVRRAVAAWHGGRLFRAADGGAARLRALRYGEVSPEPRRRRKAPPCETR